jgi:protein TonB
MMEGAFYQRKKASPTALTVVVLMHGAALTALALAKSEVITYRQPPLVVDTYTEDPPPPPDQIKPPPDVNTPRTAETVLDPPEPIKEILLGPPIAGPPAPPPPFPQGPVAEGPPTPPASPPKPEVRTVEPARAKANLASYVSDEDYPSNAVRNEEQGTTRFRLAVGPDGRVKECSVTRSSGSSALDSTTCKLMKQRARFTAARDSNDRPTGDTVASAIRWVLPTD